MTSLQKALSKKGYQVTTSGTFDKQTDNAVRDFQKQCGLTADGIVGVQTWDALLSPVARLSEEDYLRAADMLKIEVATVKA